MLFFLHFSKAPTTYGVLPDDVTPKTESKEEILWFFKSCHPCSVLSSAPSIEFLIALSPPAIMPMITLLLTPNVGGHSEASTIPNLPGVPDPI